MDSGACSVKRLVCAIGSALVVSVCAGYSADGSFTATADRTKVARGEQIQITAQFVSSKKVGSLPTPALESNEHFDVLRSNQNQSSSTSIQFINGKARQETKITYVFQYVILPKKTGTFQFPALKLTAGKTTYSTDPFTITVSEDAVKDPDAFVRYSLSKRHPYVGEQTILSVQFQKKAQSSSQFTQQGLLDFQQRLVESVSKQFSVNRLSEPIPQGVGKRINGEMFYVFTIRFSLFPLNSGQAVLKPIPFEYVEQRRVKRRRQFDPFFDDFFSGGIFGGGVQNVAKTIFSNKLTLSVKQLPSAPRGFTGVVGSLQLTADISPAAVPAGEAATLRIDLKGNTRPGSLAEIALPPVDNLEIFTPEKHTYIDTSSRGIFSRKSYKYLVIPQQQGTVEIPPLEYIYFDPETGSYKTASSAPLTLSVSKGSGKRESKASRYLTQEEIREVGKDIRYIKTSSPLNNQPTHPHRNPLFFILFPLPFFIVLFSLLYKIQASHKERNAALRNKQRAYTLGQKQLKTILKQLPKLDNTSFLAMIVDIIEEFISKKFEFAATGTTRPTLHSELLARSNCDEETAKQIIGFLEQIDAYRFGGVPFDSNMRTDIIHQADHFMNTLNRYAKKGAKQMNAAGRAVVMVVLAVSFTLSAAPVQHWFEKGNSLYEQQHYDSALTYYRKIIDAGVTNSDVLYNIGNTYYRKGAVGEAILYYEKARKLNPTDPDILTNIRFANLNIVDRIPEPERGFFELILWRMHQYFSLSAQLWLLFGLLMLLAALFSLWLYSGHNVRLWIVYFGVLVFAITLLNGISTGIKIYHEESVEYAIVLDSSVDAYNEPNGTKVLFTAHEGTKFRIRKSLDSWLLVNLPNGVSGWVEDDALGRI
jgi:tetratricopeptide (TPR) repeat protein